MSKILKAFVRNEEGLVTVEWVALASALVVGAVSIGWLVLTKLETPAATIGTQIDNTAKVTPKTPSP